VAALLSGKGYALSAVPTREIAFYRCIAARLPRGMPVSPATEAYPIFHRQSIVFHGLEAHAWHPAQLRVVPASAAAETENGALCRGPRVGDILIEADCDLLPRIADCGAEAGSP